MTKKQILVAASFIIPAACVIAFGMQTPSIPPGIGQNVPATQSAPSVGSVPEHVIYRHLFRQIHTLKNTSYYKDAARLNEGQAATLDEIADDCEEKVKVQDDKAQNVINEFRATLAKIPAGEPLPPPPPILKQLQEERDAIILDHVARLRTAIGENDFARLDAVVKNTLHVSSSRPN